MEYTNVLPFQLNKNMNIHCITVFTRHHTHTAVALCTDWHATFCPLFGSEKVGNPRCKLIYAQHLREISFMWIWNISGI